MRKKVLSWLGTMLILAGTLFPGVHALAKQEDDVAAASGAWSLSSSGPEYVNGKTIFQYTISSSGRPVAIDLVDLVLCGALSEVPIEASHGGIVGENLTLGLPHVLEWQGSSLQGSGTTVQVTYDGLWAPGLQSWYIKSGQGDFSGTVDGPTCQALNPDFQITKSVGATNEPTDESSLTLIGGGTAYYFYTVTNTGNTRITVPNATDDKLGTVPFEVELGPGDAVTAIKSKEFPNLEPGTTNEEVNTVTATALFAGQSIGQRTASATVVNQALPARFQVTQLVSATDDATSGQESITLIDGGTAYYFYRVTNTSDLPLTITHANDSIVGPVGFPTTTLEPQQWTDFTRTKQFDTLAPGSPTISETNTLTVTAVGTDRISQTLSDEATVENRAPNPQFTVTNLVSQTNNSLQAEPSITLIGGGTAYYFYSVTNMGNVPLTITAATDGMLQDPTFEPTVVPVGGTATASAEKSFPALANGTPDQEEGNTVTVTASYRDHSITGEAQATVTNRARTGGGGGGPTPPPEPTPKQTSFTLTKAASTVNDAATGKQQLTLTGGGSVYYFYSLTNTGETALTIESATDDKLGDLTFSALTLKPGEKATAQAEKVFGALPAGSAAQSETNTVSLSLRNELGQRYGPITAQATVINQAEAVRSDFTVTKRVSTTSDPATGKTHLTLPAEGGTVYYFYTVTNTGNVPITVSEAVDDKLGPVALSPSTIAPGGQAVGMLTKRFGPKDAGSTETNIVKVTTTHGGRLNDPKSDAVSVQVAAPSAPAVGSLEVRVMDGSPRNNGIHPMIAGAAVTLSNGKHGVTDGTGRILFTNLPMGEYEAAAASFDPQKPTQSELRTGSAVATITAEAPDQLIAIILTWDDASAPPTRSPQISVAVCHSFASLGGEVSATGPDGQTAEGVLQNNGTYLMADLAAGIWTVTLTAPGLDQPVSQVIHLRDDNDTPNNAYSLDMSGICPAATGAVIGRICSPRQPGAVIQGVGPRGLTRSVTVPSNGRLGEWREYRIDNLAEGDWKLTLNSPGQNPVSQTVTVKAPDAVRAADFSLACTGQPGMVGDGLWYYLSGGLMFLAGVGLRRWAKAI